VLHFVTTDFSSLWTSKLEHQTSKEMSHVCVVICPIPPPPQLPALALLLAAVQEEQQEDIPVNSRVARTKGKDHFDLPRSWRMWFWE
jgi:hypothetical protein